MDLTTNCGVLMMMEDTELRMDVSSVKKLLTQEESKMQNASTVTTMNLLNQEFTALALKLIMNAT